MRTIIIAEDALLALADYLNGKRDLNQAGPGGALVRAAQAVDAAALDVIHGERSEARRVNRAQPWGYLFLGDVAMSRRFAHDARIDESRVFAVTALDRARGFDRPLFVVGHAGREVPDFITHRQLQDAEALVLMLSVPLDLETLHSMKVAAAMELASDPYDFA